MAVDTPCFDYEQMKDDHSWELIKSLLKGTKEMRDKGDIFLPMEDGESDSDYERRKNRSFLYSAFSDTVEKCVARPFSKPVTWEGVPEEIEDRCLNDMDGDGQTFHSFLAEGMSSMLQFGKVHFFEDYPNTEEIKERNGINRKLTRKDELELNIKPFSRILPADSVIGWKYKTVGGKKMLSEVRIKEVKTIENNDWEQEQIDQVRVLRPGEWEVWQPVKKSDGKKTEIKWEIVQSGQTGLDFIPIVTVYAEKKGFYLARPPLLDLAWANLEHWQSLSDQKNILRIARFAILFAKGFSQKDLENNRIIAPNKLFYTSNEDASLNFIEHNGAAIEAGFRDIERIEDRMVVLGMQPMLQRLGNVKATGEAISEAKSRSLIETWIRAMEAGGAELIRTKARWMGIKEPEEVTVKIFSDFVFGTHATQSVEKVIKAREMGEISHDTFITEMQRYGQLNDTVDPEEERVKLSTEVSPYMQELFSGQDQTGNVPTGTETGEGL